MVEDLYFNIMFFLSACIIEIVIIMVGFLVWEILDYIVNWRN
jgi:hypothetical protein